MQRAVYELSDKISRTNESSQDTPRIGSPANTIERCVSVMSNQMLPLCAKFQKYFGIAAPSADSHLQLGSRVQTLNRQLQELLAWTKYEGQNRVPVLFPKATGNGTPRSARIHETSLKMIDDVLLSVLHETDVSEQFISANVTETAGRRVAHLISQQAGTALDLLPCGALESGLSYCEQGPELDWIALVPLYCHQLGKKLSPEQRASSLSMMKQLEQLADLDMAADQSLKHLKACFKDIVTLINTFADNVQSSVQDVQGMWGPGMAARSLQFLRDEAETLILTGEDIAGQLGQKKMDRQVNNSGLSQVLAKIEELTESLEKADKERSSAVKKFSKAWEKPLRDAGFNQVRSITTKTRFFQLKFVGMYANCRQHVASTIFVDTIVPLHSTMLLKYYINLDQTGKVRAYLDVIRMYIKCHRICDTSSGFLSNFAWNMLAMHVLFKFDFLPNLHSAVYTNTNAIVDRERVELFANLQELPAVFASKLRSTSLVELLDTFFRYYVEEFDIFGGVVTLREKGIVLNKLDWMKNPVFWRMAIEVCHPSVFSALYADCVIQDPFESEYLAGPYDLGLTLSRSGQLTVSDHVCYLCDDFSPGWQTFKALRRGVYGLYSIVMQGTEPAHGNIKKLFSRSDLIHLARKADYMGAVVLPPLPFSRSAYSPTYLQPDLLDRPLDVEKVQRIESMRSELASVQVLSPRLTPAGDNMQYGQAASGLKKSFGSPQVAKEDGTPRSYGNVRPDSARSAYGVQPPQPYYPAQQPSRYALTSPREMPKPPPAPYQQPFFDGNSAPNSARSVAFYGSSVGEGGLVVTAPMPEPRKGRPVVPPIPLQSLLQDNRESGLSSREGYYVGNSSARSAAGAGEMSARYGRYDHFSPENTARSGTGRDSEEFAGFVEPQSARSFARPSPRHQPVHPPQQRNEEEFYAPFPQLSARSGGIAGRGDAVIPGYDGPWGYEQPPRTDSGAWYGGNANQQHDMYNRMQYHQQPQQHQQQQYESSRYHAQPSPRNQPVYPPQQQQYNPYLQQQQQQQQQYQLRTNNNSQSQNSNPVPDLQAWHPF